MKSDVSHAQKSHLNLFCETWQHNLLHTVVHISWFYCLLVALLICFLSCHTIVQTIQLVAMDSSTSVSSVVFALLVYVVEISGLLVCLGMFIADHPAMWRNLVFLVVELTAPKFLHLARIFCPSFCYCWTHILHMQKDQMQCLISSVTHTTYTTSLPHSYHNSLPVPDLPLTCQ